MKLRGKTAIITGAGNGIGRAVAIEFAREHAKLVLLDIDPVTTKEVVAQIRHMGGEAIFFKCDVTKKAQVEKCIAKAIKAYEKIDILVNNAGIMIQKPITEMVDSMWDNVLATNLKGAFICSRGIADHLKKNNKGKIITISSIAGKKGLINTSAFSSANGGIIGFVKELTLELSPYKINVNAVSPGLIATDMLKDMLSNPKTKKELLSSIPMGRIGTPEEVADAVVFLASADADFITGHNLVIDGGWTTH